jgi:4-hydroxy-tetrahydrodipicolinate synthase
VLARLCDDLIAAGVHGLTPLGSTGEFAYLSRAAAARGRGGDRSGRGGRVPVVAGVAATTTADAVAGARVRAAGRRRHPRRSWRPISRSATTASYAYFKAIADAVSLPVVLYTNPNFQRSDLSPAGDRAAEPHPNIRYIKDASSTPGACCRSSTGSRMQVFAASAHIPACVMLIGGVGWMAGPACVAPRQSVELYELCRRRRLGRGDGSCSAAVALNQAFAKYNLAACIKGGTGGCRAIRSARRCRRRRRAASAALTAHGKSVSRTSVINERPATASANAGGAGAQPVSAHQAMAEHCVHTRCAEVARRPLQRIAHSRRRRARGACQHQGSGGGDERRGIRGAALLPAARGVGARHPDIHAGAAIVTCSPCTARRYTLRWASTAVTAITPG